MALSGNLKEFELPDIFQLIGGQAKTGRLELRHGSSEAYAVFFGGTVISAGINKFGVEAMLVNYLLTTGKLTRAAVNQYVDFSKGNLGLLTQTLLKNACISEAELMALTQMGIEDLTCALFGWHDGMYRFEPVREVGMYRIDDIAFSTDALTMEAMRRIDENARMRRAFGPDTVFVRSAADAGDRPEADSPAESPSLFVLGLLDGTRSVADLCRNSFLSEYRIREILFNRWQAGAIVPLTVDAPAPAAEEGEEEEGEDIDEVLKTSISVIVTAAVVVGIFFAGRVVVPRLIFSGRSAEAAQVDKRLARHLADHKLAVASLQYRAEYGTLPETAGRLIAAGMITPRDIAPLGGKK